MNRTVVLDCTLRDGGYCNQWRFKEKNIRKIISGLIASKVEIIECGFITNRTDFDPDRTKFTEISQLKKYIPQHGVTTKFVVMINYGEYNVNDLPECSDSPIDGIRVAFHKKDRYKAIDFSKKIKEKGYLVFLQPMVTMLYSDKEFDELINIANSMMPFAFYIVDSFGMMNKKILNHYYQMVELNLSKEIFIGFHSHNNLQSAFANAQSLVEKNSSRTIIIDCSIYGMGRGAGNLNSELFLNELNAEIGTSYEIKPLLKIMDEVLNRFYEENPWGYSLPNYLSAVHMIHPNYATYLSEKKTLTVEGIDEIFSLIDPEKGIEYDEKYINELYIQYMSAGVIRNEHLLEIRENVKGKKLLFIAPGKSALDEQDKIKEFVDKNNVLVISINHNYPVLCSDYVFVSNIRRFCNLSRDVYRKTISTSNIKSRETYVSIDYFNLLNTVDDVRDNAGLMAISFAIQELAADEIYLAGLDGYSHDVYSNFETRDMALLAKTEFLDRINDGMRTVLREYSKKIKIHFLTTSLLGENE